MKEIVIIGGGAAGLAAACAAGEMRRDARITVLEGAPRTGRKILASGNGRCNLMNMGENVYFGDSAFADQVLTHCTRQDVLAFFERAGLRVDPVPEEDGRVYPASGQAASVLDALRGYCQRLNVNILCDQRVNAIAWGKKGYLVYTQDQMYRADKVIVACGSVAGGKLGADSYGLLSDMGHTILPPTPALTPLLCDMKGCGALKGLRTPAVLTLVRNGVPVEGSQGEILFSDTGVSGVCAMQLGRAAQKGDVLHIDFAPLLALAPKAHSHTLSPAYPGGSKDVILSYLQQRARILPRDALLVGLLPRVLSQVVEKGTHSLADMALRLADFQLPVLGTKGMDAAQVAHGGADTRDFDPATMQSTLYEGLYAAGEVLNVDGECGGYNLLFAWAGGMLAGRHAAEHI